MGLGQVYGEQRMIEYVSGGASLSRPLVDDNGGLIKAATSDNLLLTFPKLHLPDLLQHQDNQT